MFCKLKNNFKSFKLPKVSKYANFNGEDEDENPINNLWKIDYIERGAYFNNIDGDEDRFKSVIPHRYWHSFMLHVMTLNTSMKPHIDTGKICCINFYFQPGSYRTIFYKPIIDPNDKKLSSKTKSWLKNKYDEDLIFNKSELEEIGSFVAKPYEAYLLDVSMIHTVDSLKLLNEINYRKVVILFTDKYNYNEVYEMLKETEYI